MTLAHLVHPEMTKLAEAIHVSAHAAFGPATHSIFQGEVVHEDLEYGMCVQGAICFTDGSCIIYQRNPDDELGEYFIGSREDVDALGYERFGLDS